ncbi:ATP-dependent helicase [Cryobacterium frigoriphilum]|uniref:DNA 3'-5' helicase n=1 Tax=Cryobacterium frigoriphilum TaxID=1259150 RepID=A0A4R9A253_9MICO|nr:UrvD/REP family ATP-dependent DNA helicase [Cryobacterium frigoriphilum]TFD50566.1 ATP-dependent helicase [Cryobacterium frigoriphilum]
MTSPSPETTLQPDVSLEQTLLDQALLDPAQLAVLNLADGESAAVIGAPGSGKTTTLVEFVADRVRGRGYSPSEVLVLVPTRTGATALRDRLALRLAIPTNGPMARSANSIAFQLVQGAETQAARPSPTLLTGGEQDQIIAELLQGHLDENTGPNWPASLGPEVRRLRGFRTELRDLMMRAVEYGVTPARLAALGQTAGRPEWVAAAEFVSGYEEVKDQTRPGQFDSTELAQFAAAVVHDAAPGAAGAATLGTLAGLRLLIVDDAQEVTQATLTLLAQFAARGVTIVFFGDPDISTGSFHGAHPDALGRLGTYLAGLAQGRVAQGRVAQGRVAQGRVVQGAAAPGQRPQTRAVRTLYLDTVYRHGPTVRGVVSEITSRIGAAAAGPQRAGVAAEMAADAVPTDAMPMDAVSMDAVPTDAVPTDAVPTDAVPTDAVPTDAVPTDTVQTVVVASPADQLSVIARRLRERHVLGKVPWSRMAVIVRTGSLVPALSKGLAALEVPTQVATAQTALRDEFAVRAFILALDVTLGRRTLDAQAAVELLRGPLGGLDPITLRRLRAALRLIDLADTEIDTGTDADTDTETGTGTDADTDTLHGPASTAGTAPQSAPAAAAPARSPDELLVAALTVPGTLDRIDNRTARRAAACGASLAAASVEYAAGATIEELLWGLWTRSGLATTWFDQAQGTGIGADEANHNLDAVVALFSAAQRYVERTPAAPPLLFLEHLVDTDVPEDTLAPRSLGDAVTVSTGSGTIGQQFDIVVLAGVQENVWPDLRIRGSLLGAGDLALAAVGEPAVRASPTEPGAPRVSDGGAARLAVLHDELRMFAQAASRARHELLVTAISNDDNQPSVFLRLLPAADPAPLGRFPLSLRGMVGRLRREVTDAVRTADRAADRAVDRAADRGASVSLRAIEEAATLARLAAEGVAGADPAEWYGLTEPSTLQRLNDPDAGDEKMRVSPSKMASFEACPLHWLIGQIGGGTTNTAANLGTIIHKAMEDTPPADPAARTPDALWAAVEARWGELVFDSDWQSQVQKVEARALTDRLASYLGDFDRSGGELLSAEGRFTLDVGGAVLSGTIDRVERLADGRAVIVDLKTGKGDPTGDTGVVDHPQLGAYQLAFADGLIAGVEPGMDLAGARLVIVSSGTQKQNYRNPTQQVFTSEELDAFRTRVGDDATAMGGAVFQAEIASHCLDPRSFGACRIHIIKQVSS